MSNAYNPIITPATVVKNAIIFGVFLVISFFALRGTVPSEEPQIVAMVAFVCAFPMAIVAWIAWHMVVLVRKDDLKRRALKNQNAEAGG
ncbi:MAG: hypothetical protein LAT58_09050 [Opitutales bacterium]|nr:hypothetical protein [Opitutales bacterium]